MPFVATGRLDIRRDRSDDVQRALGGDIKKTRGNSRRQTLPEVSSIIDSDDDNAGHKLLTREAVESISNGGNSRRQILPPSSSHASSARPSRITERNDNRRSKTLSSASGLTRRATEPPTYKTVESLSTRPSQGTARSKTQHGDGEDSEDGRSQATVTERTSGNSVTDWMQKLRSPGHTSSRNGGETVFPDSVSSASLARSNAPSTIASENRQLQRMPHGRTVSDTVITRSHGKLRRLPYDTDASDDSNSDNAYDDRDLVRVVETYRPKKTPSHKPGDLGKIVGMLGRSFIPFVIEDPKEALHEAMNNMVEAVNLLEECYDERKREGKKPSRHGSLSLEVALRGKRDKAEH